MCIRHDRISGRVCDLQPLISIEVCFLTLMSYLCPTNCDWSEVGKEIPVSCPDTPKSLILTAPSADSSTLAALMSLCTRCSPCRYSSACNTSLNIYASSGSSKGLSSSCIVNTHWLSTSGARQAFAADMLHEFVMAIMPHQISHRCCHELHDNEELTRAWLEHRCIVLCDVL